jgi:hypothetical protein
MVPTANATTKERLSIGTVANCVLDALERFLQRSCNAFTGQSRVDFEGETPPSPERASVVGLP